MNMLPTALFQELKARKGLVDAHASHPTNQSQQISSRGSLSGKQAVECRKVPCPICKEEIHEILLGGHVVQHSSCIEDYLYLGAESNARNLKELKERTGVTHILNMARELPNYYPDQFEYLEVGIEDDGLADLSQLLPPCFQFIDAARAANQRVLVHCAMGASRSATVVIAYLLHINKDWSFQRALEYVKARRPIVNPNLGFVKKLEAFAASDRELGGTLKKLEP